ncbi:MAG: hypothetical protein ACSHW0_00960 [Thalassotalea sp.]
MSFSLGAVEVIVHNKQQLPFNSLTTYQIRQIYTMRQHNWQNGQAIVVYTLSSDALLHQKFSKNVLKIFPYQLDRVWRKLTYSGLGKVPIVMNSIDELKAAVKKTPGSIGYIDKLVKGETFDVIEIKE